MKKCEWHLCEQYAKIKYCSEKCKNKASVDRYRKRLKLKAVEYMGGRCKLCGYDKYIGALQFHHLDPLEKDFGISSGGHTRKWSAVKKELDKCILLCSNCHTEVHASAIHIP